VNKRGAAVAQEPRIYQVIDGKLVPKPGNQRDVGRRYAQVVAHDETYLREFTPEEETARDAEEAKWRAEQPLREAAEQTQKREREEFRRSLSYESRLCVFLDVLGWRDAVARSETDPELVKQLGVSLQHLVSFSAQIAWQQTHDYPGDPQVTQFSDCILISSSSDHAGKRFLIGSLWFLTATFLKLGFPIRGAVTLGQLYHRGQSVFGPALVRAYDIERKSARFPRVLLDDRLAEHWWPGDTIFDHAYPHSSAAMVCDLSTGTEVADGTRQG
jgi:hypothetical protein